MPKNTWTSISSDMSLVLSAHYVSIAKICTFVDMCESLSKYLFYLCVSLSAGDLLEELLCILSSRNLLTRAALHLLLLPQLSCLSLASACSLVNANLCSLIQIRCQVKHTHSPSTFSIFHICTKFAQTYRCACKASVN